MLRVQRQLKLHVTTILHRDWKTHQPKSSKQGVSHFILAFIPIASKSCHFIVAVYSVRARYVSFALR